MTEHTGGPIVVGVDPLGTSDAAVLWGAAEAARRAAPLILAHAIADPPLEWQSQDLTQARMRNAADELLQRWRDRVLAVYPDLEVHLEVTTAPPVEAMLDQASRAQLLVVGSHGRGALGRLLLGSVGHSVVSRCPVPIAVVRDLPEDADAPVVVGVEESDQSALVLDVAFRAAQERGVALVAVHAWRPDTPLGYGAFVADPGLLEQLRLSAERVLAAALSEVAPRYPAVEVRAVLAEGDPASALAQHAQDAQLLVVGSNARGRVARLVLGSVSTNVLYAVTVPTIVVRAGAAS